MKHELLKYDEMVLKAKDFYKSFNVIIPDEFVEEAVISLFMPQYVKEFNENKYNVKNNICLKNDHRALSTVGDAVCKSFWMLAKYSLFSTQEKLIAEKETLKNDHLNVVGLNILEGKLFATNNNLDSNNEIENKKSYATAFEAVIGFVSLIDINKAFEVLKKIKM